METFTDEQIFETFTDTLPESAPTEDTVADAAPPAEPSEESGLSQGIRSDAFSDPVSIVEVIIQNQGDTLQNPELADDQQELIPDELMEGELTEETTEDPEAVEMRELLKEVFQREEIFQAAVLENQQYMIEQNKNLFSVTAVLLLAVGFASGILLSRVVFRKL